MIQGLTQVRRMVDRFDADETLTPSGNIIRRKGRPWHTLELQCLPGSPTFDMLAGMRELDASEVSPALTGVYGLLSVQVVSEWTAVFKYREIK